MADSVTTSTTEGLAADEVDTILREMGAALVRLDRDGVTQLADLLRGASRVFVTGEGRSGFMSRAFAMRLMHLGLTTYFIGDTCTPAVRDGDVVIGLSGSGGTASTLRTVSAAASQGCRTVAVTSDPSSPLAQAADLVVHVPGATKHRRPDEPATVQPLSSLFDQCVHVALDAVALRLARLRNVDNAQAVRAHANTE